MLGYYIVKLFSKLMCVSPKWFRDLLAKILGYLACVATPKWRMEMAKANIMECLGVNEERATMIAQGSMKRFGRMVIEVLRFPLLRCHYGYWSLWKLGTVGSRNGITWISCAFCC